MQVQVDTLKSAHSHIFVFKLPGVKAGEVGFACYLQNCISPRGTKVFAG